MSSWTLAPALVVLGKELDKAWPNRDRTSDGTLGDAAHAARQSEHNPNRDPNDDVPDGYVTARDIDTDGIPVNKVLNKLIGDSRVWYVIHNRTIWSKTYGWKARAYTGADPHTGHIHVSLNQNKKSLDSKAAWGLITVTPPAPKPPVVKYVELETNVVPGKRAPQVPLLQRLLNDAGYGPISGAPSTFYGENTEAAVRRFHKAHPDLASGPADSKIGPKGFIQLQKDAAK